MYTVYKITNLINGKVYIGSSICVEKRWKQHINSSQNPNNPSYIYPLQGALRKYGIDKFDFSILSNNFNSTDEMEQYEYEMICTYDSVNNGYNQTYYTHCALHDPLIKQEYVKTHSQLCAKVDKEENIIEIYESYQDADRKNGNKNNASHIRAVCKGLLSQHCGEYYRDLDKEGNVVHIDFKNYKNRKPVIGINIEDESEIYADSILEASKKYNLERSSIEKCIRGEIKYSIVGNYIWRLLDKNGNIIENEINIQQRIDEYNKRHPVINGVRHSIQEWANIYNIQAQTINARIRAGWDSIEAITTPLKK